MMPFSVVIFSSNRVLFILLGCICSGEIYNSSLKFSLVKRAYVKYSFL